jgi:hypothetical protein
MVENRETTDKISVIFVDGRKVSVDQKIKIFTFLQEYPECPTSILIERLKIIEVTIEISVRQVNRYREEWGFSGKPGRPKKGDIVENEGHNQEIILYKSHIASIGIKIFDEWLDQEKIFSKVIKLMKEAIEEYKDQHPLENFPVLQHREQTLICRFKALFYAPLFGIGKLTEFDIKEHELETVIQRSYQSTTLNQFLGQLERVDVSQNIMPALIPEESGYICYIDGHMIAFWTRASMHKGKITMLGRIMPGSNAVISHNDSGTALFVEYFPPDIRLPKIIIEYCNKIVSMTGIKLFVIDREINSLEVACEFESNGWGLISMLDKNEYKDLSDWDTQIIEQLDDGSKVYSGPWKDRQDDIRHFVIVEKADRLLPYWGTPTAKELLDPVQWPKVYSQRTELQENSFKGMINHSGLNVNFGTKKIIGPDRHQERKKEKLDENLVSVSEKIKAREENVRDQEKKVKDSQDKGHGKRLEQRQENLSKMQAELEEIKNKKKDIADKIEALGPPKQRQDRDFRKQRIMTFRTLLLENLLKLFLQTLHEKIDIKLSLESLISLLFKRSGAIMQTCTQIIYWFNTDGLSKSYKEKLKKIITGINALNLSREGRLIQVRLREAPS